MTGQTYEIAVAGDLMLDVFEKGTASRLSPEAPVVVLVNPKSLYIPGGAANTAANVFTMGARVTVHGHLGDDEDGRRLEGLLVEAGMNVSLHRSAETPTTVKRRFLAGGQQVLRVDYETLPESDFADKLVASLRNDPTPRALVLSDYDKGTITDAGARGAIAWANEVGIPVIVDSKKLEPDCFAGCTVIAPNHLEATAMTRTSDPYKAASLIAERTRSAVIVTLGAQGMLVQDEHGQELIASDAVQVSDVTGAGDTVTAALAVAIAEGASVREAARWANSAAAVAVAHLGTHAVERSAIRYPLVGAQE